MKLIVGLGNPGPKYETTRHNVGFLLLDLLADEMRTDWSGRKFDGEFARGNFAGEPCVLLKPMTFMNLSGGPAAQTARFFKVDLDDIVVVHDDMDVPHGKVKARVGGGHGGHNGVRDLMAKLGNPSFHRLKVGVGRPPVVDGHGMDPVSWVLGSMTDEELKTLADELFPQTCLRLEEIFKASRSKGS